MTFVGCITIALALAGTVFSATVQKPNIVLPPSAAVNRAAVEKIFIESYAAYKLVQHVQYFVICYLTCWRFLESLRLVMMISLL